MTIHPSSLPLPPSSFLPPPLKKVLKAISLELRHLLEGQYDASSNWEPGDLERRLAAIGVRRDREPVSVDELAHLAPADQKARQVVDAYLTLRAEAGVTREDAVAEFVRETAYTWANRLLALRCMEARDLIDEVILQKPAYGGRSLEHHRLAQRQPELCAGEDDGLLATLDKVFADQARHLPLLFDPEAPGVALKPSAPAIKRCVALLSGTEKANAGRQAPGDLQAEFDFADIFKAPDALGWAYQYWNTEEKDRVFAKVRTQKGAKIEGADIVPATQLYTEPYMVKFLVQNSLGATWMGMHPDSKLPLSEGEGGSEDSKGWEYYVRDADRVPVEHKPIAEVTFLDPACGSGHFLLEAFDLFYDMYEEEAKMKDEGGRGGKDEGGRMKAESDSPDSLHPSSFRLHPSAICRSILERNLFGIDIDARAVQIAEATLWMKAAERVFPNNFPGVQTNLVAAVASHLKGPLWEEFLKTFEKEPHLGNVLARFGRAMEHIDELGSLARPEEALQSIVRDEHAKWERARRERADANYLFPEMRADALSGQLPLSELSDAEFGDRLLASVRAALDAFTEKARSDGRDPSRLLGRETQVGLRWIDVLGRKFDVIAANPPYMGTTQLSPMVLREVARHSNSPDLYCALMLRWIDLQRTPGIAALVTRADYLTQSECEELRSQLLSRTSLRILVRLENRVFRDLSNPNAIFFSMQVHCTPSSAAARIVQLSAAKEEFDGKGRELIDKVKASHAKTLPQSAFEKLPRKAFALGLPEWAYDAYAAHPLFSQFADARQGLITGDTLRFLRYRWETPLKTGRWRLYAKGGEFCRWFGNDHWAVDWECDGVRLRGFVDLETGKKRSRVQNTAYYGRRGLSWSSQTVSAFAVRLLESGSIFDTTGSSAFLHEDIDSNTNTLKLMGILNSPAFGLLFRNIQPGVHYGEGYLETLPCPSPTLLPDKVAELVARCVDLQMEVSSNDVCSSSFNLRRKLNGLGSREKLLRLVLSKMDREAELYATELAIWELAESCLGVPAEQRTSAVRREAGDGSSTSKWIEYVWRARPTPTAEPQLAAQTGVEEACVRTGTTPEDARLALTALENARVPSGVLKVVLTSAVEALTLAILGHRWPRQIQAAEPIPELADSDGIIPLTDDTGESALAKRMRQESGSSDAEGNSASSLVLHPSAFDDLIGKPIDEWLAADFFRHHTSQFNRRPIAWQIQSGKFAGQKKPAFACLVYYHKLDGDLLPKLRKQYAGNLQLRMETELRGIEAVPATARSDRQEARRNELGDQIQELQEFDAKLREVQESAFATEGLRATAIQDGLLCLKQAWLRRLTDAVRSGPLGQWVDAAREAAIHADLPGWIEVAMSQLDHHCTHVGPDDSEWDSGDDPTPATAARFICTKPSQMVTEALTHANGCWAGQVHAVVIAPLRQQIGEKQERQKALKAELKASTEGDTTVHAIGELKAELDRLKIEIRDLQTQVKDIQGRCDRLRALITGWHCPGVDGWQSWLAEQPLFDAISSVDGRSQAADHRSGMGRPGAVVFPGHQRRRAGEHRPVAEGRPVSRRRAGQEGLGQSHRRPRRMAPRRTPLGPRRETTPARVVGGGEG